MSDDRLAGLPEERPAPLATRRFAQHARELEGRSLPEIFAHIHETNLWGGDASVSGVGSEEEATSRLREALPVLLRELGARVLLDIPCGDFGWLSRAALEVDEYIGADIVASLVRQNALKFGGPGTGRRFLQLDLTQDALPLADVVLCRDFLVHLSNAGIGRALGNVRRSGSRYLLTTTFTAIEVNRDIANGDWRPINLEKSPFRLPPPLGLIVEGCQEEGGAYADKSLGLWEVAALPP